MAYNQGKTKKIIIDETFIKFYKPLLFVQTIIGSVRVSIRRNSISELTWKQSAYSLFFMSFTYICFRLSCDSYRNIDFTTKYLDFALFVVQTNLGAFLNAGIIVANNFFGRDSNRKLYLTLQKIDGDLKVTGKRRHNRKIYAFIILDVIITILYHGYFLVKDILRSDLRMFWIVPPVAMLFCVEDCETILYLTMLLILHKRLTFIKKMIDFGTEIKWQQITLSIQVHHNIMRAFDGVVEAIWLTEKVFRNYMLLLVSHLFFYHLLGARKLITTVEIKHFRWSQLIIAPDPHSVRFITRLGLICFLVNLLEDKLIQTKDSCITALEKIENMTSRCYLKNIIRIINTVEPMSVYRMFAINSLALELMALTMNYAIVLLQFAYS